MGERGDSENASVTERSALYPGSIHYFAVHPWLNWLQLHTLVPPSVTWG